MLSYLFECVVARDKNESTESMWRPPFPPPSSPPLDSKSWKKELERRKEILKKGEGGKGDARVCTHLGQRPRWYLCIYWLSAAIIGDCSGHFRFMWNRALWAGGEDERVVFSGTLCSTVCSRIDECKRWYRWWDTIRSTIGRFALPFPSLWTIEQFLFSFSLFFYGSSWLEDWMVDGEKLWISIKLRVSYIHICKIGLIINW